MMLEKKKKYIAPEMDVIDMECRTILCDSGQEDPEPDPDALEIEDVT